MEPLEDRELDALLKQWQTPAPPAHLRARVLSGIEKPPKRQWTRIWTASIRIPLPVALALACALALTGWRWTRTSQPQVIVRTERVEVPVVTERVVTHIVYRERPVALSKLQPVMELRPRIIRSRNAENE